VCYYENMKPVTHITAKSKADTAIIFIVYETGYTLI
jgi:hypothetical protein